jgi:Biopolymer transport protein
MNFVSNKDKSSFSIEITPLIDIVFLLVIFFVVTSKVGESQFLSLDLPKTESFDYKLSKHLMRL